MRSWDIIISKEFTAFKDFGLFRVIRRICSLGKSNLSHDTFGGSEWKDAGIKWMNLWDIQSSRQCELRRRSLRAWSACTTSSCLIYYMLDDDRLRHTFQRKLAIFSTWRICQTRVFLPRTPGTLFWVKAEEQAKRVDLKSFLLKLCLGWCILCIVLYQGTYLHDTRTRNNSSSGAPHHHYYRSAALTWQN